MYFCHKKKTKPYNLFSFILFYFQCGVVWGCNAGAYAVRRTLLEAHKMEKYYFWLEKDTGSAVVVGANEKLAGNGAPFQFNAQPQSDCCVQVCLRMMHCRWEK